METVVRQYVVSVPQRAPEHGFSAGSSVRLEPKGYSCSLFAVLLRGANTTAKFRGNKKVSGARLGGEPERMAFKQCTG